MATVYALCQAGDLKPAYEQAWSNFEGHPFSQLAQDELHQVVRACLEKAGRDAAPAAALRWLRKLASLHLPPHPQRDERLGWTLRGLLAAFGKANVPAAAVGEVLAAMLPLPLAGVPGKGHSVLLQAALKHRDVLTADWLSWWNGNGLRPEDWQPEELPDGRRAALTLAEQLYGARTRCLLAANPPDEDAINDILPQLDQASERLPTAQWLPYYKAKLQLRLHSNPAEVLKLLLPVVRQKSGEFWAWQLLSETLEATDPAAALACLYKASTCGSEEKFLGKVRLKLARLLADTHPGEARWQLNQASATYAAEGWSLKGEALPLAARLAAYPAVPAEDAHREWRALAEQTTYGDLPWQPVVLQSISEETPERPALARLLPAGNARPVGIPLKKYRWLQRLPLGSPLQMRSEEVAGRTRVVQLEKRAEGQLWDTLPGSIAVVTGFLPDKGLAFFAVHPTLSGAFRPADFKLTGLQAGDVLHLRLQAREKDGETKHYALAAERSAAQPDARVCRQFAGSLKLHEAGFGFADNVFLPAALVQQNNWQPGDTISGRAVMQRNKKKGKDEWNVVSIG